jgi:hypothetical protein
MLMIKTITFVLKVSSYGIAVILAIMNFSTFNAAVNFGFTHIIKQLMTLDFS